MIKRILNTDTYSITCKNFKKYLGTILIISILLICPAYLANAAEPNDSADFSASAANVSQKGGYVKESHGKIYCYNSKGVMQKNKWYTSKQGRRYYLSKNGAALTGKKKIKGKTYIFSKKGVMLKGLCRDYKTGKRYYTDPKTGIIKTGFVKIKRKTYYFSKKKRRHEDRVC